MSDYERLKNLDDAEFAARNLAEKKLQSGVTLCASVLVAAAVLVPAELSQRSPLGWAACIAVALFISMVVNLALRQALGRLRRPLHAEVLHDATKRQRMTFLTTACPGAEAVRVHAASMGRRLYAVDLAEMERRHSKQKEAYVLRQHPSDGSYHFDGDACPGYERLSAMTDSMLAKLQARLEHRCLWASIGCLLVAGALVCFPFFAPRDAVFGPAGLLALLGSGVLAGASWYLLDKLDGFQRRSPFLPVTTTESETEDFLKALKLNKAMREVRDEALASGRLVYGFDLDEAMRRQAQDESAKLLRKPAVA